jgi:excisionase family DNA binding protein
VDDSAATRRARARLGDVPPRFLLLSDVAETLNISLVQARALVTSGELPAIQVGGRGQWRVEASELEAYIQRKYAEARAKTRTRTLPPAEAMASDPQD